ncbi:MAG: hypothetical protein J7K84_00670 [Deltaproteobacteria bacterium]|nr:hypothetical protein [Deltaproteobacteria bacterium]
MKSKLLPVNILLTLLIIFFAVKICRIWDEPEENGVNIKQVKKTRQFPVKRVKKIKTALIMYADFIDQDLFNPDRRPADIEPSTGETKDFKPNTDCILYGILIVNDNRSALIADKTQRRGIKQKAEWIKESEKIGSATVETVLSDRIILKEGRIKTELLLVNPDKPKPRLRLPSKKRREIKKTKVRRLPPKQLRKPKTRTRFQKE